MIGEF